MIRIVFTFLIFVSAAQSQQGFISIDGADLKSKLATALTRGSAQGGTFWVAYAFEVRPGVVFDTEFIGSGGSRVTVNGAAFGADAGTRNLGVFLMYEGAGRTPIRAEIYNLDRRRDYSGYPVHWLGRISGSDSLPFLRGLIDTTQSYDAARHLVDAIGAHDDARVATALRDIVRGSKVVRARTAAVSWLGHSAGQTDFLAALVRDERETVAVRREAAEAIGESSTSTAVLQDLYRAVTHREVKRELLEAMGERFEPSAVAFLIETIQREPDRDLKEEAIDALADMEDDRAIDALARAYDSARDEEMKKEILDALGDAESSLALQKLQSVAQRDPSIRLRRRAIEALGESHDPSALRFLEQLIK